MARSVNLSTDYPNVKVHHCQNQVSRGARKTEFHLFVAACSWIYTFINWKLCNGKSTRSFCVLRQLLVMASISFQSKISFFVCCHRHNNSGCSNYFQCNIRTEQVSLKAISCMTLGVYYHRQKIVRTRTLLLFFKRFVPHRVGPRVEVQSGEAFKQIKRADPKRRQPYKELLI